MTKKETFEKRFAERYADADLSNEEAYYEHANQLMDDYENYEQATKNLLDALDGNDVLVQMLTHHRLELYGLLHLRMGQEHNLLLH